MPSGTWCQVLSLWAARRRWNPIRIIAIIATTSITMVAATPISSSSSPFIPRPRRHPGPPRTAHRGRPTGSGHHPHLAAGGPDRRGGELVVGQQFVGAGQRRTHRFRGHLTADGQRQKRSVVNSQAHGCALSVGTPGYHHERPGQPSPAAEELSARVLTMRVCGGLARQSTEQLGLSRNCRNSARQVGLRTPCRRHPHTNRTSAALPSPFGPCVPVRFMAVHLLSG